MRVTLSGPEITRRSSASESQIISILKPSSGTDATTSNEIAWPTFMSGRFLSVTHNAGYFNEHADKSASAFETVNRIALKMRSELILEFIFEVSQRTPRYARESRRDILESAQATNPRLLRGLRDPSVANEAFWRASKGARGTPPPHKV